MYELLLAPNLCSKDVETPTSRLPDLQGQPHCPRHFVPGPSMSAMDWFKGKMTAEFTGFRHELIRFVSENGPEINKENQPEIQ